MVSIFEIQFNICFISQEFSVYIIKYINVCLAEPASKYEKGCQLKNWQPFSFALKFELR